MIAFMWFMLGIVAALSPCFLVLGLLIWRCKEGSRHEQH